MDKNSDRDSEQDSDKSSVDVIHVNSVTSDEEEEDISNVVYYGKRDSNGKPNGRGTLTWINSGTRFEGRFCNGMKNGKGSFYFPDNSTLSGNYKSDELNGMGVYTYSDGSRMEAFYVDGELNGPFIEYNSDGIITVKGSHKDNKRVGFLQIFDAYGGIIMGVVDAKGCLTGSDIAYVYPDHQWALMGHFINGEMKEATPAKLLTPINETPQFELQKGYQYTLSLDESTSLCISSQPLAVDLYEQHYVYVSDTIDKGQGLFAKVNLKEDQVVSFYNGIRLTHSEVDARPWSLNSNTISLDENTVLDVPPSQYSQLDTYCASLGHKANHSNAPNCKYDEFMHPRFGFIKCIRTIEPVTMATELTCDYGYLHKFPGTEEDDLPQWFVKDTN